MDSYLIESPHAERNCRDLLDLVKAAGYLHHFDWGCVGGVNCSRAIIEAENEAQARLVVPPLSQGQALVVKIAKLTPSIQNSRHRK
jgi:hypothetical protein